MVRVESVGTYEITYRLELVHYDTNRYNKPCLLGVRTLSILKVHKDFKYLYQGESKVKQLYFRSLAIEMGKGNRHLVAFSWLILLLVSRHQLLACLQRDS